MIAQIWIFQVILAIVVAFPGHELLPEKYLKPRDFNYHPYTDVGVSAALKKGPAPVKDDPFEILEKLRPRESRDYSNEHPVYHAIRQPSVLQKKVDPNELPKNYAFTYTVKDHLSGDDFSHSQAHNGKATKGQYRVKLPDGRTQIVSYTADHKGYRADVQYEEKDVENNYVQPVVQVAQPVPIKQPEILHKAFRGYPIRKFQFIPVESATMVTPTITPKPEDTDYVSNHVTLAPVHLQPAAGVIKLLVKHHGNPQLYSPVYLTQLVPAVAMYQKDPSPYVSSTSSPEYSASTVSPQVRYITSTPLYPTEMSTRSGKSSHKNYPVVSSTAAPTQHAILVTPRPVQRHSDVKAVEPSSLLIRLLK